ncbi:MAG: hypothetical protein WB495_09465, partial [Xanthobacteraceae bacterium]
MALALELPAHTRPTLVLPAKFDSRAAQCATRPAIGRDIRHVCRDRLGLGAERQRQAQQRAMPIERR